MGNICSWCLKTQDESQSNGNLAEDSSGLTHSERSLIQSEDNERTPLIGKSDNHSSSASTKYHPIPNGDSSIIAQSETIHETRTVSTNETAETRMAFIVEGMLSKLIDVGGSGSNLPQTNSNTNGLHSPNDQLRHLLSKSLSSTKISTLPDVGLNNLPSLLSARPISSDVCHFVAHTAGELSRLLIDEIKIIHKEDLVVVFE